MSSPQKIVHFRLSNFIMLSLLTLLLILSLWVIFIGLTHLGCPCPVIDLEKFFDLGFFSISIFGVVIFLTIVPFQTVEGKLSPAFYSRLINTPLAHFGLYILMMCAIICFMVIAFEHVASIQNYLSQLFIALVLAITSAILFHRFWVLRCLYQPYIVFKYIQQLKWEEAEEEVWLELFECTFKAIQQGRISDAKNFLSLMNQMYSTSIVKQKFSFFQEDVLSLYEAAKQSRPIARYMEKIWPFCLQILN